MALIRKTVKPNKMCLISMINIYKKTKTTFFSDLNSLSDIDLDYRKDFWSHCPQYSVVRSWKHLDICFSFIIRTPNFPALK